MLSKSQYKYSEVGVRMWVSIKVNHVTFLGVSGLNV